MGLFDFLRANRAPATLDAGSGELRRNELAAAIDRARNPQPANADAASARRRLLRANAVAARMFMASADTGRLTGDWSTNPVPVDWIVSRYQRTLVARSREQAMNNDVMKAFLRLQRLNIVGPQGIRLHSQAVTASGKPDKRARWAVENWWSRWSERDNCDVTGSLSWRNMLALQVETTARDGECFFREITGPEAGGMGFALQVIDPQRCPVDYDRDDGKDGNFVKQGIEFTRYGRAVAYYFTDDTVDRAESSYYHGGKRLIRVPASEVIHFFIKEFPGQKRGLPWASTGLFRAKQKSAMEDAAVVNARVGASKMGFIEFEQGFGPEFDEDEDDLTIDAEAGAFPILPSGAKLNKFDPMYPTGELVPFVKLMDREFAAGAGVSYHSLSGDLTDVNFSSIRHGTLDERESYKERQELFAEGICERVKNDALAYALLAGHVVGENGKPLPATKLQQLRPVLWQGRRWSWIDPTADVQAAQGWKNGLFESPSQLIREEGQDPEKVWAQIGEDIKAMEAAGIPMEVIVASFGIKPQPPAPGAGNEGGSKP